jgi:hypothetical protein
MRLSAVHVRQIVLGLALAPLALWIVALSLLPTAWLRDRAQREVERAIDHPVRLSGVRIGLLGEVRLLGLELGEPLDPWLRVDEAKLDASLWDGLRGRLALDRCRVRGMRLRVHRKADGSLECAPPSSLRAALTDAAAARGGPTRSPAADDTGDGFSVELDRSEVTLVDDQSGTRLELADVESQVRVENGRIEVADFKGSHGDGTVRLAGVFESRPDGYRFETEIQAEAVELDQGLGALAYLLPLVAGARGEAGGRIDLEMHLRGHGARGADIASSLAGFGAVAVSDIVLTRSPLIDELSRVFDFSPAGRIGSVVGRFSIRDRRIHTRDMTIRAGFFPIALEGWNGFDGTVDYTVRCADISERLIELAGRLPAKARTDLLASVEGRRGLERVGHLRLTGTLEHITLSAGTTATREALHGAPLRR